MPSYDRGDLPRDHQGLLRYLWQELGRLSAFCHSPRTDGAWEDLRFPAQAINPPGGLDAPTWDYTNIGQGFDFNADNALQMIVQFPYSWKEGTNIKPHIHWEANTGFSLGEAVVWTMAYRWRNNGETLGALTTTTITVTPSHTLALMISSFPEISGAGKDISSIMDVQITRLASSSAADTLGATAVFKEFDIQYLVDSFGSDKEIVK